MTRSLFREMNRSYAIRAVLTYLLSLIFSVISISGTLCAQTTANTQSQLPVPAMVGVDNSAAPAETYNPDTSGERMMVPPPVGGQTYPIALGSQERSNYLESGLSFTTAYMDNVLGGISTHPVSDITYSVAPFVQLDETTARMHLALGYAPGFTFYQRTQSANQADHNGSIDFEYRLSSHVTLSARDNFQKSSNPFNQPPALSGGFVSGGILIPDFSVVSPAADQLSNYGNVGINYQFALNDMVGASGTFSTLYYPDQAQVPGLSGSSSQSGLAFYSHRLGTQQYIGVTYTFQRIVSTPTIGRTETQTQAALLFYTFAPGFAKFSISLFGGPQYVDTMMSRPLLPLKSWTQSGGASLGWQAHLTSFALSYSHIISGGGGLGGAVSQDSGSLSVSQQLTKTLQASMSGGYMQNNIIGGQQLGLSNGHSIFGSAFLQQTLGEHVNIQLGYTRVHQSYSDIEAISSNPDINRESISISYQFSKSLGK